MRIWRVLSFAAALTTVACASTDPLTTGPSPTLTMTGGWVGTTSDSTGSMMGAGLNASMMTNTTWTITQTGSTFSGTMRFAGYMGGAITVSGVMNGHSGTFTMTMPSGTMMSGWCSATATGTFDTDDMMTQFDATYNGMNSCSGAFDHGQVFMHR
jgi:hypothetical protein